MLVREMTLTEVAEGRGNVQRGIFFFVNNVELCP